MKKLILAVTILLFVASVFAQEVGYSNKIEEAVANCVNCNVCPDGKVIGEGKVCLYFFWGQGCPHCAEEKPFLDELKQRYPVEVYEFEVYSSQENAKLWGDVCRKYGFQPVGVPTTFVGDKAFIGFTKNRTEAQPAGMNYFIGIAIASVVAILVVVLLVKKVRIKVKT